MFPLAGKEYPTTCEELAGAIQTALEEVFTLPVKGGVDISGGKFPAIKTIRINLNHATVSASDTPAKPSPAGKRKPGIKVAQLEVTGQPIQYEQARLNLKISASGLEFDFARDKRGRALLVLTDALDGTVEARITRKDIQFLLQDVATMAARQQGIAIQDLELDLKSDGPRSVAASVRVKAKKMMMTGIVNIHGKLDVDDELNATLSNLACTGEGMIGTAAAGIVQKKIVPYEGMEVPLMAFSLGDVTLRDLKISVKESVQVSAAFGKSSD